MVSRHWQDQYKLMGATVPQSVYKLLEALEFIKKAFPTEKECEGTQTSVKGGGSSKKKIPAFSDPIPKKRCMDAKHCVLCKQHGGKYNTRNTMECRKYEKDRTPKKAFIGKGVQRDPHSQNAPHRHNNTYVQLSTKIAKLEKSNKKLKCDKKRKHDHECDSKDSDSS
jgi:hypothetical protein